MVSEENMGSLTGSFPNLMAGQSHVRPNRPARAIHVPVPPSKYSPCTRHHCTFDSRRNAIHDEMWKITSGPDGGVRIEDEVRFLRNRFTGKRERSRNARAPEHDAVRFAYKTPLERASAGGRKTVQIAGLKHRLWRSSGAEENVMRP